MEDRSTGQIGPPSVLHPEGHLLDEVHSLRTESVSAAISHARGRQNVGRDGKKYISPDGLVKRTAAELVTGIDKPDHTAATESLASNFSWYTASRSSSEKPIARAYWRI